MATVTFKTTENRIAASLIGMINRAKDPRAFLRNVMYPMYVEAQKQRWVTENQSETGQWRSITSEAYRKRKERKYASFRGAGRVLMIATGRLSDVATGRYGLKRVITTSGMILSIDDEVVPYAKYVASIRPIMAFGEDTRFKMKTKINQYLMGKK